MKCEFYNEETKICSKDSCYCEGKGNKDLGDGCPTYKAFLRGEPMGKTFALGYAGMRHTVRTGIYGSFVTGIPPEYLTGDVKDKDKDK